MDNLRIERDGELLRVTLARPDRHNAFDAALIGELAEAFVDVGRARAVVLAGDGESFSAGADVDWMRSSVDLSHEENIADAHALRLMLEAIDTCPAPVVARVQGFALGGGAGRVAAADIAIAASDAVFAFSEVEGAGIIPAVISPFALAELVRAPRGAISSRASGSTPARLASGSCMRSQTTSTPRPTACSASVRRPLAVRWAKRLDPRAGHRARRPRAGSQIGEQADEGQEGLLAFLEKRPASEPTGTMWGVYKPRGDGR